MEHKKFKCEHCNSQFTTKSNLSRHKKEVCKKNFDKNVHNLFENMEKRDALKNEVRSKLLNKIINKKPDNLEKSIKVDNLLSLKPPTLGKRRLTGVEKNSAPSSAKKKMLNSGKTIQKEKKNGEISGKISIPTEVATEICKPKSLKELSQIHEDEVPFTSNDSDDKSESSESSTSENDDEGSLDSEVVDVESADDE